MKKIKTPGPPSFRVSFTFVSSPKSESPEKGGALYVSTYPSSKPTFCPKREVSVYVGLGEGKVGSFPETYNDPNRLRNKRRLYSTQARKTFRSSYRAKVGERESNHEKRNEGGGGGEKRKRFPANPTIL